MRELRGLRLILYREDIDRIAQILSGVARSCGARAALLLDREGRVILEQGDPVRGERRRVPSLASGAWVLFERLSPATRGGSLLLLTTGRAVLGLSPAGDEAALALLFRDGFPGDVASRATAASRKLGEMVKETASRKKVVEKVTLDFGRHGPWTPTRA